MTTAIVLANGPSRSREVVEKVRGCGIVVVVNDIFRWAPWADALVANDRSWWHANPDALEFKGRKFCGQRQPGTEAIRPTLHFPGGSNSGLQGMRVAWQHFGATRILLCFFDMHGTTQSGRTNFKGFRKQFARWPGCEVINCTPGSALKRFPFMDLDEALRN
jgi:hypothetical protein